MTDRMNDDRFDDRLREFLAWQADDVGAAPTAAEVAARLRRHTGGRTFGLPVSQHLAWIVLAGLLILGLVAAAAVGGQLLRSVTVVPAPTMLAEAAVPSPSASADAPTPTPSATSTYEAVFVRWDAVVGLPRNPDLVVISVDLEGRERETGRLTQVAMNHISGLFYPRAALSNTGLLAYPRPIPDGPVFEPSRVPRNFHWEILDLADPDAHPIVVPGIELDYDQLAAAPALLQDQRAGVFWGPRERLAILWLDRTANSDSRLTFADGRTGDATTFDPPGEVAPYWAADGSGVFIAADGRITEDSRILRPDGSFVAATAAPVNICRSPAEVHPPLEQDHWAGRRFTCIAPDGSADVLNHVRDTGFVEQNPFPRQWGRMTNSLTGTSFEIEGAFAGWMEVEQ